MVDVCVVLPTSDDFIAESSSPTSTLIEDLGRLIVPFMAKYLIQLKITLLDSKILVLLDELLILLL